MCGWEIMDSGAYLGQEHVKRVWYTMGRRMDKHGNMIDTSPKVGEMSNTNTDRAFLLLMLTISSPLIEISEDGTHAWGQWHIFGPHTNRVFDPETKTKTDTAFWIAGKYDNEFVKENGEWKIPKLRPICRLRTPYHKGLLGMPGLPPHSVPYYPPDEAPPSPPLTRTRARTRQVGSPPIPTLPLLRRLGTDMKTLLKNCALRSGVRTDILVEDGLIAGIGSFATADQVYDMTGYAAVLPGFIDAHMHLITGNIPYEDTFLRLGRRRAYHPARSGRRRRYAHPPHREVHRLPRQGRRGSRNAPSA